MDLQLYKFKNSVGERCYKNVCLFIFNVMSPPHSSATAERILSTLTNIKTKNRNSQLHATVYCKPKNFWMKNVVMAGLQVRQF